MKVGIALNITGEPGRADAEVVRAHLGLAELAEELGFDSVFVLEHHFSGYVLSPSPFQLLAYLAARTQRVTLGTAVLVLPWHHPVRLAEEMVVLDQLSAGRCVFGVGRGAAAREFDGLGVPLEESRQRFEEVAEILQRAFTGQPLDYEGAFHRVPGIVLRPRPSPTIGARVFGAAHSAESAAFMARLGFGMLASTQKEWDELGGDVRRFAAISVAAGNPAKPPLIVSTASVASNHEVAQERARAHLDADWDIIDRHYNFSGERLSGTAGYEGYARARAHYARIMSDSGYRTEATAAHLSRQIVGTPRSCVEQIDRLRRVTGTDHLVLEVAYGGMDLDEAERNMRSFAEGVLPFVREPREGARDTPAAAMRS